MKRQIIIWCVLLLPCLALQSQTAERDAGTWICASLTPKPLNEKLSAIYTLEYRSKDNFRQTDLWSVAANLKYAINPYLQIGAGYEFFMNKCADGSFSPEYRYYPEATVSYKLCAFAASLRLRMMNTFTKINSPHWVSRNRLKVNYKIAGTSLKPFVAAEPYCEMRPVEDRFRKTRYYAGCAIGLTERQQLDVYYLREAYTYKTFARNIIAIDYNYMF